MKGEKIFVDKRVQKLDHEKRIASGFVMHKFGQRFNARRLAVKRFRGQLANMRAGERGQLDLIDLGARVSDGSQLGH